MTSLHIKEVATKAGVTPRTVHFYIQQGLLPPPDGAGRAARYSESHLARLQLIRRWQKEYLPLSEIRHQLGRMSDEQIGRALANAKPRPANSALDYIHSVRSTTAPGHGQANASAAATNAVAAARSSAMAQSAVRRSQWDRIALDEDIELHIRRPLSRERNRCVDRLLAFAKQLTEEEQR